MESLKSTFDDDEERGAAYACVSGDLPFASGVGVDGMVGEVIDTGGKGAAAAANRSILVNIQQALRDTGLWLTRSSHVQFLSQCTMPELFSDIGNIAFGNAIALYAR